MSKTVKYILLALGVTSILALVLLSFFRPLWLDPSIILVEMERIAEGYIPYKTMHLNYPPLLFYLMAGLKKLFNVPYGCYQFYLAIHYLFSFGCAYCVYGISKEFGAAKWLSLAAAWFFLILSIWLWGDCVLFEIPTAFWGLLACFLVLRFKENNPLSFIFVGLICALSFLTKQFGAGFFPLGLWLVFTFSSDKKVTRSGLFTLGYLIPILVCLLIWGREFISSTILNGYGNSSTRELIGDQTTAIGRYIMGMIYVCTRFPMIPLAVLLLPKAFKEDKWKQTLFCLFGIGGFSLQFAFTIVKSISIPGDVLHYLLLLAPFIPILTSVLASMKGKLYNGLLLVCCTISLLFSTYKLVRWSIPEYFNKDEIMIQQRLSDAVSKYVYKAETAWIVDVDLEFLYYSGNLRPAVMDVVGYSTSFFEMTAEKAKMEMRKVDYVILYDLEGPSGIWRIYYDPEVQSYVEAFPKIKIGEYHGIDVVLYDLKKNRADGSITQ